MDWGSEWGMGVALGVGLTIRTVGLSAPSDSALLLYWDSAFSFLYPGWALQHQGTKKPLNQRGRFSGYDDWFRTRRQMVRSIRGLVGEPPPENWLKPPLSHDKY